MIIGAVRLPAHRLSVSRGSGSVYPSIALYLGLRCCVDIIEQSRKLGTLLS